MEARPHSWALLQLCVAALIVSAAAVKDIAGRRGLLQDRLGVKTSYSVEAPEALLWSAGVVTAASGPAAFSHDVSITTANPPSLAVGINPHGGYAEVNQQTRIDHTLPTYHLNAKASLANMYAVAASVGGPILPVVEKQIKVKPTVPVTMPVFSFGGKVLPEPQHQVVINPRTPPALDDKAAGDSKRRLLNYGASKEVVVKAPTGPKVEVSVAPGPAIVAETLNVRSEKPNVVVNHQVPGAVIDASGDTNVDLFTQPGWDPKGTGKGTWITVNAQYNPAKVTSSSAIAVNWPKSSVVAYGNNPLAVEHTTETTAPGPSKGWYVSVMPQLGDRPDGYIQSTSSLNIPIGR